MSRVVALTKDAAIPISLSLLFALVLGVWALAVRVAEWEHRLDAFESKLTDRWTYQMERESWQEYKALNPSVAVPNVSQIKAENGFNIN